jgi:hypothetical protein
MTTHRPLREPWSSARREIGTRVSASQGAHDNENFNGVVGAYVLATVAPGKIKGEIYVGKFASHNYFGGPAKDLKSRARTLSAVTTETA